MGIGFSIEFLISSFAALTSALGLLFVGIQARFSAKLARAQFLDKLSEDVNKNIEIEVELEPTGRLYNNIKIFDQSDRQKIIQSLSFFDRLAHLYELGFIKIEIIDKMFAYRFFILVHNPNTQKFELLQEESRHFWRSVFALHKVWYAYRKRKNLLILRDEYAEKLFADNVYKKSKL